MGVEADDALVADGLADGEALADDEALEAEADLCPLGMFLTTWAEDIMTGLMDWMMKGLALSCLGGGLLVFNRMSDMACWA